MQVNCSRNRPVFLLTETKYKVKIKVKPKFKIKDHHRRRYQPITWHNNCSSLVNQHTTRMLPSGPTAALFRFRLLTVSRLRCDPLFTPGKERDPSSLVQTWMESGGNVSRKLAMSQLQRISKQHSSQPDWGSNEVIYQTSTRLSKHYTTLLTKHLDNRTLSLTELVRWIISGD